MTETTADAGTGAPVREVDSAFYWDALDDGRIALQRCTSCRELQFPPMPGCRHCGGRTFRTAIASGRGTLYSWTTVHYAFEPEFAAQTPYTIVEVAMDEGVRLIGRLAPGLTPVADLRVVATIEDLRGMKALVFRPAQ